MPLPVASIHWKVLVCGVQHTQDNDTWSMNAMVTTYTTQLMVKQVVLVQWVLYMLMAVSCDELYVYYKHLLC